MYTVYIPLSNLTETGTDEFATSSDINQLTTWLYQNVGLGNDLLIGGGMNDDHLWAYDNLIAGTKAKIVFTVIFQHEADALACKLVWG